MYHLHPQASFLKQSLYQGTIVGISESLSMVQGVKGLIAKTFGIHSRTLSKLHTINGPDQLGIVAFTGFL